ncbi:hypothetical protein [Saccharopolyspora shandongensis]|uniref:hypothetical protein n=1 Tax=Saccharopolyspora shandongensis TaxID=418495 RepID=UPI0033D7D700
MREARALEALLTRHGFTQPVCQLCGKDHHYGHRWEELRNYVEIVTVPDTGDELLGLGFVGIVFDSTYAHKKPGRG